MGVVPGRIEKAQAEWEKRQGRYSAEPCVFCGQPVVRRCGSVGTREGFVAHFVCHAEF